MDRMASPLVVVGSLNADLVVHVARFPRAGETLTGHGFARFPGGKGANQAYAAARLGAARVRWSARSAPTSTARGSRPSSPKAASTRRFVLRDETEATGVALITIDAAGQNQIVLVPGANGTFTPERFAARRCGPAGRARRAAAAGDSARDGALRPPARDAHAGAIVILDPAPAQALPDALLGALRLPHAERDGARHPHGRRRGARCGRRAAPCRRNCSGVEPRGCW